MPRPGSPSLPHIWLGQSTTNPAIMVQTSGNHDVRYVSRVKCKQSVVDCLWKLIAESRLPSVDCRASNAEELIVESRIPESQMPSVDCRETYARETNARESIARQSIARQSIADSRVLRVERDLRWHLAPHASPTMADQTRPADKASNRKDTTIFLWRKTEKDFSVL
ncbi:hypothetical protein BDB00DRAFT_867295 [Zychaea mexicana]|uniref:uncharacterized protein n=1 Tax=Zychaea mexicana TaxID=64656 RepID=UPI0022FE7E46|nr:uncharacterized protein BDB00DRAFT_867295 [Zychaea mexicana]KAI9498665.1 hypothetical protein BDB00DRAFT_867295 [Zychaea mexicana]